MRITKTKTFVSEDPEFLDKEVFLFNKENRGFATQTNQVVSEGKLLFIAVVFYYVEVDEESSKPSVIDYTKK